MPTTYRYLYGPMVVFALATNIRRLVQVAWAWFLKGLETEFPVFQLSIEFSPNLPTSLLVSCKSHCYTYKDAVGFIIGQETHLPFYSGCRRRLPSGSAVERHGLGTDQLTAGCRAGKTCDAPSRADARACCDRAGRHARDRRDGVCRRQGSDCAYCAPHTDRCRDTAEQTGGRQSAAVCGQVQEPLHRSG